MNILITCCLGDHIKSNVEDIRKAYPDCKIVGIDMRKMFFNHNGIDKFYKVPRCDSSDYLDYVLDICKDEQIDIVISFSSLDIVPFIRKRERFDELGIKVALSRKEGTIFANDKFEFYEVCKQNNVRIPKTSKLIKDSKDLFIWMSDNGIANVVTKMSDSTGAKGMNFYSLSDISDREFSFDEPVIAQEYLNGPEYSVDCFCKDGKMIFGCVKLNYEMDLGVSIYSEVVDRPDLVSICEAPCELFELDGLVGFDLKEDDRGNVYILECNPRPTATISLIAKSGVNLLQHLIEYYMTGNTCFYEAIDYGMKIVRYRDDFYFKEEPEWKQ